MGRPRSTRRSSGVRRWRWRCGLRIACVGGPAPGCERDDVGNWVADHLAEEARQADPLAVTDSEFEELRRLRHEVAELRTEREILRKAAAYFAQETMRSAASGSSPSTDTSTASSGSVGSWRSPIGVLRLARPAALGAVGQRRRARRVIVEIHDDLDAPTAPHGCRPSWLAGAALWPQTGRPPDALPAAGGRARPPALAARPARCCPGPGPGQTQLQPHRPRPVVGGGHDPVPHR